MCETRDLDIKWPQWHTLIFEGQVRADMRYVCPKRREEDAFETGQVSLLEEVGCEARVRRIEGRFLAPASSGSAAEENKGRVDLEASKCRKKMISGRRLGAEKTLRHWLVG